MFGLFRKKRRGKRNRKLRNTAGFSLVELLVAVAIFGIAVGPLLSVFVISSRLNAKGRQKEQAMTIAQNLMEGIKAFGLEELAAQCTDPSLTFTIIPENSAAGGGAHKDISANVVGTAVYVGGSFVGHSTSMQTYSYQLLNGSVVSADIAVDVTPYEFRLENILLGSGYYDADITIVQNTDENYVFSGMYASDFEEVKMQNLKYYDVEINVYVHPINDDASAQFTDSALRATYTGTFLDKH